MTTSRSLDVAVSPRAVSAVRLGPALPSLPGVDSQALVGKLAFYSCRGGSEVSCRRSLTLGDFRPNVNHVSRFTGADRPGEVYAELQVPLFPMPWAEQEVA